MISETILIAVFSVLDLLYFYILYEMILIPLYYLMRRSILLYPYRKKKITRAIKKLIGYTLMGSVLMLIGIIVLKDKTGSTNYMYLITITKEIEEEREISRLIFIVLFIGLAIKIPIMPLHIWLPEAHSEAPTAGSILLAGVLLKLGTYGIIRYIIPIFPRNTVENKGVIEIIIIISIIYSSLTILRQVEIKKFIAYSSISHMNLALLGLLSGELDSIIGGYILMINHGLITTGLFYSAGILFNRYELRAIKYYRGLIISMPLFSFFWLILNLSNIGFPPFGSYISEILIYLGCFQSSIIKGILASISIILSGGYGIWIITRMIYGKQKTNRIYSRSPLFSELIILSNDLTRKEFIILVWLSSLSLLLGLFPTLISHDLLFPLSFLI